jgi:hypothetical protein
MLNKLMMGVALSAFALSGAMAQSTPSPSSSTPSATPPAASSPAKPDAGASTEMNKSSTNGAADSTSSSSTASSTSTASETPKFVSTQNPDQWLASKFKGTDVIGTDDKKIGDVSDILFDKDGKIEAFVISVGGFLGMGAKDVALAPTAFEVVKGKEGESDKLKLAMSKDELKQAQNFEPYKEPSKSTTGAGARPGGVAPAGGGMKPATPPATSK